MFESIASMKYPLTLFFLMVWSVQLGLAADFRYLRTNEGLYIGEINSITQDHSGKMWFATWAGLVNYNGYDFQFFKPELENPLSLPDKKINKIFNDSKDHLWIASLAGVSYYSKENLTFHSIPLEGLSAKDYYVVDFFESKGYVIALTTKGLFLIDDQQFDKPGYHAKKLNLYYNSNPVTDYIHVAGSFNDQIILLTGNDSRIPKKIFFPELVFKNEIPTLQIKKEYTLKAQVNAIEYVKSENKLYIATDDGIHVLLMNQGTFQDLVYFKGINVLNLLHASDHHMYCYSNEPALMFIDLASGQTGKYLPDPMKYGSLLDNRVMCLFEDFSGNLWVGSQGQGISILNLNQKEFHSFKREVNNPGSLSGNMVMCFNGTDQDIFIGLREGGLNRTAKKMDPNGSAEFQVICYQQKDKPDSPFDHIWDLARESDSVFWVASDGGLTRMVKINNRWLYGVRGENPVFKGTVRKVMVDAHRNVWCGTFFEGLLFLPALRTNPTQKIYRFPIDQTNNEAISDRTVISMLIDSKNRFWVGTVNGLNLLKTPYNQLDLSGKTKPALRFKQYFAKGWKKDVLNANEINCIFEQQDGNLWFGTQGGGINIMDMASETFSHLTTEDGLPGNDIQGILPDQAGRKWISTYNGIVSVDLNNKSKPFTYYSHSDGIQGETFKVNSYFISNDGEMFFGGDNGFTRFYPHNIRLNPIPPQIGFTNLRILNRMVNIGDTISKGNTMTKSLNESDQIALPFAKNSFSIGVGVHHYQYPEGNTILYQLEGYNDRWIKIPASNRNLYFSMLPSGKYTLHVRAQSADNVDSIKEKTLQITVWPPWYRTWYMTTIFILLLIITIAQVIYQFINRQRKSFQKKIDAIEIENNENKMKFLTNIAHELRTPLSLVVAPIEDMMQNAASMEPKWKNHISLIYRNSNYLLTLINQIIDFRKLNAGKLQLNLQTTDIVALVVEVVANFKGLESRRKTNLQVSVPESSILVKIDRQKIEEVLYNLLSNAFKHTGENQSIVVSLKLIQTPVSEKGEECKQEIIISVFNEGKDISDQDKVKIFEHFYKVSENIEGAGIGLSFSKSLVEMHRGTITVESVDEIGVEFHVSIPFEDIEMKDLPVSQPKPDIEWYEQIHQVDPKYGDENLGKDLSIVIVEDNDDLRTFLNESLSLTYNCHEACNGSEGYELIARVIPDIVISDVLMPEMDGYELCEKVKENIKTCHIPIILLTAKNASEHIIAGYEKGADAYVTKPFNMTIIKAQISRLIRNRELIRRKYVTQNFMVEVTSTHLTRDDEFILQLRQLLEEHLADFEYSVQELSLGLNMSKTNLYRKVKSLTGLSPVEFMLLFKMQRACELLSTSDSIKTIGYSLGFKNLSYFIKCFKKQFGVTPLVYRQKGLEEVPSN
ncbi:MAG TPA: two-component regulator propeller domain-containing protein [Prolixibacteraceae bacterium]|jgi:signal transduction histidine kinase/DNA-binding response OmpR family regulator/ligand-binding sensor domain-containing protein